MILLAVLLLPAAVLLYRSDRRGLRLHLLYIPLQMVASGFFAVCVMESIYNSVAGMIFYVGAIPGLIGCVYPVLLLMLLRPTARAMGLATAGPIRKGRFWLRRLRNDLR
jgi:hypothetical protein